MDHGIAALNISERKLLNEFLEATARHNVYKPYWQTLANLVALVGLLLFVYTSGLLVVRLDSLAVSSLNSTEKWMFASGLLAGAAIAGCGLVYPMIIKRIEDRKRLGDIVQKLLRPANGLPSTRRV